MDEERGIIPRAIQQVGKYMREISDMGWEYRMEVSFVEIYNETVKDLLRDDEDDDSKHDIKLDSEGRPYVSDVTMIPVDPNDSVQVSYYELDVPCVRSLRYILFVDYFSDKFDHGASIKNAKYECNSYELQVITLTRSILSSFAWHKQRIKSVIRWYA